MTLLITLTKHMPSIAIVFSMLYGLHQQDKIKQMRGSFLMMFRYESLISNPFLSEQFEDRSDYKENRASMSAYLEKS